MTNEVGIGEHIKGFFVLQSAFVRNYFNILILAITLGIVCGFTMVLFNYLLLFFKISFSYLPYFIRPVIAGIATSLLIKLGNCNRIMGTAAAEFIDDVNNSEPNQYPKPEKKIKRKQNLLAKTMATSWTYGSGMVCGIEGPGLLIGGNIGYIFSNLLSKSDM